MIVSIIALSIIVCSLIVGAVGDGLNNRPTKVIKEGDEIKKSISYKPIGHILQTIEIGILVSSPFILDVTIREALPYLASYGLLRASLFNPLYNIGRGVNINYIGNSNIWDKFLRKLKAPNHGYWFARGIFVLAAVWTIFKYL